MTDKYSATFYRLQKHARRLRPLAHLRPNVLATPLYKLMLPTHRRGIVRVDGVGLLYIDPASHLGSCILETGTYEPETIALLHEHLKPGDTVLDIGANEGVMSVCAASIVGSEGCVLAVEPQSRLLDVLEINLALNSTGTSHIIHGAVSDRDDEHLTLSLFAEGNTGASSIVSKYRWSTRSERVPTFTVARIVRQFGIDRIDLVKIDVEGFEMEVVQSLFSMMEARRVGTILLDYHSAILKARGMQAEVIHQGILDRGYRAERGSLHGGFVLYKAG